MSKKYSAGLLIYRKKDGIFEAFLGHPGGPFFSKKDEGAWDIPKGEADEGEESIAAAIREFEEETGINIKDHKNNFSDLGEFKRKDGKVIHIWAFENGEIGKFNPQSFVELEWPPKSGKKIKFPEIDRAEFFPIEIAERKANTAAKEFIKRLKDKLKQ